MSVEQTASNLRRVGFVGFGAMAQRMATRLRDAGYQVNAYDPNFNGQAVEGFDMVASPADLARAVDVVIISVPADNALTESSWGDNGLLAGARDGLIVLDTSTVSVGASQKLAKAAKERGVRFVETPVSGSTPQAEKGQLVVLAGGESADIEAAAPILDVIARKTVHVGAIGEGLVMKYIINGVMAIGTAALAEGLAYGVKAGLERTTMIETLQDLIFVSEHHRRKLDMAKDNAYPAEFPTSLLSKDMGLLLADANRRQAPMGTMAAGAQLFTLAAAEHGQDDYAAAIATMETIVGGPSSTEDSEK